MTTKMYTGSKVKIRYLKLFGKYVVSQKVGGVFSREKSVQFAFRSDIGKVIILVIEQF